MVSQHGSVRVLEPEHAERQNVVLYHPALQAEARPGQTCEDFAKDRRV